MNTSFERTKSTTCEWYTPLDILKPLGEFDLDPCAPISPLWPTANHHFTKENDGLTQEWFGRVWLNPPYSRPLIECFVKKMATHGDGIALLFNRCDSNLFQDFIFPYASAMLFMRHRIKFYRPDGTQGGSPGCGSILVAFGAYNADILNTCGIKGCYIDLRR